MTKEYSVIKSEVPYFILPPDNLQPKPDFNRKSGENNPCLLSYHLWKALLDLQGEMET